MKPHRPRFKVGDVVCSSLGSPRRILEIRVGKPEDFPTHTLANGTTFRMSEWEERPCYVMQFIGGKSRVVVRACVSVDSDHHLEGTEMYELYNEEFEQLTKG